MSRNSKTKNSEIPVFGCDRLSRVDLVPFFAEYRYILRRSQLNQIRQPSCVPNRQNVQ